MTRFSITAVLFGLCLAAGACRRADTAFAKPAEPEIAWRPLGSWSGHGNTQTESFTSDSGSIRVEWTTKNGSVAKDAAGPTKAGGGMFRLTIHSAISGRPLMEAVDEQGVGNGTAFVHEDPRVFFAVVESADLDWSFTLQEALFVERKRP
jgi:hypothetical protein